MKKIYLFIAIAAVISVAMVSCQTKSDTQKIDSTEMAQFEAWKASQEKANASEMAEFEAWKVAKEKPVVHKKSATRPVTYRSPVMTSESQNTAKVKKGWSKAAKGTVIGAGAGAILGAVINKRNRAAGAVIGGILGGGAGYGIGRHIDKKDGRS